MRELSCPPPYRSKPQPPGSLALARGAGAAVARLAPDPRYLPLRLSAHRSRDLTRDPVGRLSHRIGCKVLRKPNATILLNESNRFGAGSRV